MTKKVLIARFFRKNYGSIAEQDSYRIGEALRYYFDEPIEVSLGTKENWDDFDLVVAEQPRVGLHSPAYRDYFDKQLKLSRQRPSSKDLTIANWVNDPTYNRYKPYPNLFDYDEYDLLLSGVKEYDVVKQLFDNDNLYDIHTSYNFRFQFLDLSTLGYAREVLSYEPLEEVDYKPKFDLGYIGSCKPNRAKHLEDLIVHPGFTCAVVGPMANCVKDSANVTKRSATTRNKDAIALTRQFAATVIVPVPLEPAKACFRMFEAVLANRFCFVHSDADPNREWGLYDMFYVRSADDVHETLKTYSRQHLAAVYRVNVRDYINRVVQSVTSML